jgi:YVTN family beta-propeller protein
VGSSPFGVAITPDGAFAYVANLSSNNVSVIATATNTVVATVPVGTGPRFVAITPDGAFAYVTNGDSNNVSVIDTATNTVGPTVAVGVRPFGVAITPDGAFVYVTNQFSDNVSVIDTATNTVVATVKIVGPVGVVAGPVFVAITPDGAFAFVSNFSANNVSVIDTATNTDVAGFAVGAGPAGIAITPDGAFVYVVNDGSDDVSVFATASNTVVATVAVGNLPLVVAITPASPLPEAIAKTLENGPRVDGGSGTLIDLTGLATGSKDAGPIDVGRSDSQFYEFLLKITNTGSDGELDGKIISDPIPDTYDLDPLCGDDPVAASTSCDAVGVGTFVDRDGDTFPDGIINDTPAECTVSTSTSEGGIKKDGDGLEPEFVTIVIDDLDSGETCTVRVFVRTDENPADKTGLFEPVACRDLNSGVFDTIPLNQGVKLFDPITGERLLGPVGSLQLTPNNCP